MTRVILTDAINILVSSVQATGYSSLLRQRMEPVLLQDEPFRQLAASAGRLRTALQDERQADALQEATYLRALLDACRRAADSVMPHLEPVSYTHLPSPARRPLRPSSLSLRHSWVVAVPMG